jgi:glutathione-specific gamma-glutamylcyclotransferase
MPPDFHPDAKLAEDAENCRHIFAYGSLIWNPGFEFTDKTMAQLSGYHRSLCVFSNHYRGTSEKPGLVLGLDLGGTCNGIVYRIAGEHWTEVLAYVRKRELVSGVYKEVVRPVRIRDSGQGVNALTYVVDRQHEQYAGKLEVGEIARFVGQGHGLSGTSRDYVENTLMALKGFGIEEKKLQSVLNRLSSQT